MHLNAGVRVGPYEIVELIGAGGMGEVYRARDPRLKRDIAVKVLPAAWQTDDDRTQRFQREAELLAALNHPAIAAIYGVEESGGSRALLLELVEGPTLAEVLAVRTLTVSAALPIVRQLIDALDAAHERGIVHRDLKPANIKVRADGTVKVLDFGLGKIVGELAGNDGRTQLDDGKTRTGAILGTAAYMSPEQVRGQPVDRRTDIWAFGCVVYEMLAGRRAFEGATGSDTVAAILDREPDWSRLPRGEVDALTRLIRRCLEKDRKLRLRDIADARIELDAAAQREAPPLRGGPSIPHPNRGRPALWVATLLLAILTGTAGWLAGRAPSVEENPIANAKFTRLTDFEGIERDAAISPDGKFVAFVSDRDGPLDIWLSQIGTGRLVNLTQGKEPNLDSALRVVGFTHEGSEIWFHDAALEGPLRLLPLVGGPSRIFLDKSPVKTPPMNASWAPDGTRVVYHTSDPGDPMFVTDRTGANPRQIFIDPARSLHNHFPAWSQDGQWVYFVRGLPDTGEMDVWRIASSGGEPERLTQHSTAVASPTPLDERTLVYVARDHDGSGPWLWAVDVEQKEPRRISFGLEKYVSVASSADGKRLAATVSNPRATLWSVPIQDGVADERDAKPFSLPTVRALSPRFRGSTLFYLSSPGTGDGLWRYQEGQSQEIWKGSEGALLEPAAISPDGKHVAIVLRRNGKVQLHVMTADGNELQAVAQSINVRGTADWSPDGKWIVSGGEDSQGPGLFKIPVAGGLPVKLASGRASNPVWSPDGTTIVYVGANVGPDAPLLAVREDGTRIDLPSIQVRREGQRVRFLPNGKGVIYMQGVNASGDFWLLDIETLKARPLTQLDNAGAMLAFDITPDGKQIVFDRLKENSDIVLIDLQK